MSEALRLADLCRTGELIDDEWDQVADILERLHAENEALRAEVDATVEQLSKEAT